MYFFSHDSKDLMGQGHLYEVSRAYSDMLHSVGLFWMSDVPQQETLHENTQRSQQIDIHAPGGTRTRNPWKREVIMPTS